MSLQSKRAVQNCRGKTQDVELSALEAKLADCLGAADLYGCEEGMNTFNLNIQFEFWVNCVDENK